MSGGSRKRAGRKPVEIDVVELEKLCSLHCTDQDLASWFGVSVRTIESRRKQRLYAEAMERGKTKGRISVRRAQMKLVEAGNATIVIWMGKQLLGQRDVIPIQLTGQNEQPIQISLQAIDALMAQERKCPRTTNKKPCA
jgi:hypothetical protein